MLSYPNSPVHSGLKVPFDQLVSFVNYSLATRQSHNLGANHWLSP